MYHVHGLVRLNLKTAVDSGKYAHAFEAPREFEKSLITNKVTTSLSNTPCTSTSFRDIEGPLAERARALLS